MPFYIKSLKHLQIKQFIREEGPASHAVKDKTPTTGGAIFAIVTIVGLILFFALYSPGHIFSLAATLTFLCALLAFLCAVLGASDDLSKITKKNNRGLTPRLRLFTEIALGLIFGILVLKLAPAGIFITAHNFIVLPSLVFLGLSVFLVTATTNAVNLHDGMDGLASGTTMLVLLTLAVMLWQLKNYSLGLLACSSAGALGGFLLFNRYPAKIFMGDTGSLFLGGLLAALVLASGLLVWFVPLSMIYVIETLSVIAQVSYFKLTKPYPVTEYGGTQGSEKPAERGHKYAPTSKWKALSTGLYKLTHKLPGEGKRLFRMAPLHHHFETVFADKGLPEWQVVLGFWFVQLLLCLLVLAIFFTV